MKKTKVLWIAVAVAAVAVVAVVTLKCTGKKPAPEGYRTTEVAERMANREYVAKIENLIEAKNQVFREISEKRKAYLAAKEGGADEAEVARLKAEWEKASLKLNTVQQAAELTVRDEILRQQDEAKRNAARK